MRHPVTFWVDTTVAGEYFVPVFSVGKNSAGLYRRGDTNRGHSKSRSKKKDKLKCSYEVSLTLVNWFEILNGGTQTGCTESS